MLPDDGLPVGDEPAQRHLEEQMRHHGSDGVIDPRPEFRQVVAEADAAERRPDRGRREAVEQPALVDRERPVHQIGDAAVGRRAAPSGAPTRAPRTPGRQVASVARIGGPERAGIAAGAVAEHEVLAGHWTMK